MLIFQGVLFQFCGSWWINAFTLTLLGFSFTWMFVPQMGLPRCPELLRFIDSQSDLTFINGYHFIQLSGRIVVHIKFAYFLRTKIHFLRKNPAAIKDPFLQKKRKKCGGWWKTMLVVFVAIPRSAKKFHLACFDRIPWRFWLKHVEGRSYRKLVAKRKHHAEIDDYSLEIGLFRQLKLTVAIPLWSIIWVVVSEMFNFHYLGKISNVTNIFQRGWNHQPDYVCRCLFESLCLSSSNIVVFRSVATSTAVGLPGFRVRWDSPK